MTIFNLYIYNGHGECIHYRQWNRDKPGGISLNEEFKLMYGMLLSLRSFTRKLSPTDGQQCLRSFQTSNYKLNYFETPTGWKMVLNTDNNAHGVHELLRTIYAQALVGTVIKNPLIDGSQNISSELFAAKVDELVQNHSSFI